MPSEKPDRPAVSPRPPLVLLVEDNPIIAMNTEALLLEMAVDGVRTAASVAEAMALIETEKFDLGILDVNLGKEDSLPVAERLAALHIPVVFATGLSENLSLGEMWRAAPMLKKPYGYADLEQIVRAL